MNTENDRHIDELIGNILEDNVPADIDRRLRSQLENFRHQLIEMNKPTAYRPMMMGRRAWLGVSAAAAATIAVAAVIWWSLLPRVSLADVAATVLQQPWIHARGTDPQGTTNEFWYSPTKDVSAWHDNDWIEYRDHRLRIYYAYDLHDKILYRVPESVRRGEEQFASLIASLRILLQSKQPVDNPLERLGIPLNEQKRLEVVKQEVKKVKQDDREWLDYHLTVMVHDNKPPEPGQIQWLFRVDSKTELLRLVRFEGDWNGQHKVVDENFDYPEKGPADVYDLGVPKTAKVVDRVPANELARILETLRAGRERMDNYRAVLVARMEGTWRPQTFPEIIYRKGNKFRRDTAIWIDPSSLRDPKIKWPQGDKGAGDWWKQRVAGHCFLLPMNINHGSTDYTINSRCVTDPDGSVHTEITGVNKREDRGRPGEIYPALYSWMPEFACRPPMGIPQETMDPVIEPNPTEGPADTILLRVRRMGQKPPPVRNDAGKLLPSTDAWRYWLDPARDYVVVRWDMVTSDLSGKESLDSEIIDKMARSPQGTWYATQIRNKGAIGIPSEGKSYDQIIDIYVDFNANLPDSLFEPPAVGQRIH